MGRAMIIRKPADIPYSQVTPKHLYLNRRRFLAARIEDHYVPTHAVPLLGANGLYALTNKPKRTLRRDDVSGIA